MCKENRVIIICIYKLKFWKICGTFNKNITVKLRKEMRSAVIESEQEFYLYLWNPLEEE